MSWNWTFGDDNISADQHPIHTYTLPGNYSVALTVSNGNANDTVTKEHYIQVQQPLPRAELIFNANYNRGTSNDTIASGTSPFRLAYLTGVYNLPENQESILGNLSFTLDAPEIVGTEPDGEINGTRMTWTFPPSTSISPGTTLATSATTSVFATRPSGVTLERSCNRTTFTEAGVQHVTLNMTFDTVDLDNLWGRLECTETDDIRPTIVPGTISTDLPLRGLSEENTRVQFTINRSAIETGRQYTLSCAVEVDPLRPVAYAPACAVWEVRNSTSAVAPAGTAATLPAELLPENVSNVTFSSDTPCEWSCTQNDHVISSLYQRAVPALIPVANFTANVTSGTTPLAVQFTDTSTGDPTTRSWAFGDGATSTEQHPVHTYTAAGTYTVNLTVENSFGANYTVRSEYIIVGELPLADFDADPASGIAPLTVQFTDRSSGVINTWNWTFGDGSTSTEQHPTHEYASAGDYTVSLRIANAWGENTTVKIDYVHVGALPVANFTANVTAGPAPFVVRFADTSTGNPSSWSWSFGDGATSTDQNPTHIYTTAGNYTVNLTVGTSDTSTSLSRPGYITVTVKGDVTGDGIVDIGDVARVAYMVVGKTAVDLAADFNGNGKVDIGDAAKIAYFFVEKIGEL